MAKREMSGGKTKQAKAELSGEQIDSLLDRLDEALLAGDQAKMETMLEQLWTVRKQVPEVLTARIIAGHVAVPAFSFEILGNLAGSRTPTYLKRIAQDTTAPDTLRFNAQIRAGWPLRGEQKRRLEFLTTLKDPESTLIRVSGQGVMGWLPDGEIVSEVLSFLEAMPSTQRTALVERAAKEKGGDSVWLLRGALHISDPAFQRVVLTELVNLGLPGSAGAVERLQQTTRDAGVRKEAEAAVARLRTKGLKRGGRKSPEKLPAVGSALISMIDGAGAQVVVVRRDLDEDAFSVADVLCIDTYGVKDAFGLSYTTSDGVEGMMKMLVDRGIHLVQVDIAAVRATIALALGVNASRATTILPRYEVWEPLIHDFYPPKVGEAVANIDLDDEEFAGREDLISSSGGLFEHAFFHTWLFDHDEIVDAMYSAPHPTGGRLTDRQYVSMVETLMDEQSCSMLRSRLRRQAWLLNQAGYKDESGQALAVAAQLAKGPGVELSNLPFLRTLIDRSVVTAMEEMAEAGTKKGKTRLPS